MTDQAQEREPNYIRLYLAEAESGWGDLLDDGTVKICNNALGSELCVGDIVTIKDVGAGLPVVDEILKRRHEYKSAIRYDDIEKFKELRVYCAENYDCAIESFMAPSEKGPGIAMVAFESQNAFVEALETHGVSEWLWEPDEEDEEE